MGAHGRSGAWLDGGVTLPYSPWGLLPHPTAAAQGAEGYKLKGTLYTHAHSHQEPECRCRTVQGGQSWPYQSQHGWLRASSLARAVLAQDKGGRVALFADACLPRPAAFQAAE